MIDKHLADASLQQFVLDEAACTAEDVAHLRQCPHCLAKAENYRLLFSGISQEPKPSFDFDLPAAVLNRIAREKPKYSLSGFAAYLVIFSSLLAVAIPAYIYQARIVYVYRKYVLEIISGVSSMVITFLIVTILIFIVFQCVAMFRKYQQKINDLNFY